MRSACLPVRTSRRQGFNMKAIRILKYFLPAAGVIVPIIAPLRPSVGAHYSTVTFSAEPQTDASTSLSRGRSLLKQGHADQALPLLQSALSSFTQSKDARGIAAAEVHEEFGLLGEFLQAAREPLDAPTRKVVLSFARRSKAAIERIVVVLRVIIKVDGRGHLVNAS